MKCQQDKALHDFFYISHGFMNLLSLLQVCRGKYSDK